MIGRASRERRKVASQALRLGQPLFIQVPRAGAASALTSSALIAIMAKYLSPSSIELGGIFLLICAFAAWFVGNRFAVMLGAFIVTVQYLSGWLVDLGQFRIDEYLDQAFRLGCFLIVVLMLGVARVALEIEWRHARIDPLTGALNRKAFFEAMGSGVIRGGPAILVFADLDGLKDLNDSYGHEEGDEALRNLAISVRKSIRGNDLFARIGGDEFVLFLSVRDVAAAQIVAERLNQAINLRPNEGTLLKCSLGILFLPSGSSSIDLELRHADALMYEAKRADSGFSIAILGEGTDTSLLKIASGINPSDLYAAKSRSEARHSGASGEPVGDSMAA